MNNLPIKQHRSISTRADLLGDLRADIQGPSPNVDARDLPVETGLGERGLIILQRSTGRVDEFRARDIVGAPLATSEMEIKFVKTTAQDN